MRGLTTVGALALYEEALREAPAGGDGLDAVGEDGSRRILPIDRWLGTPDATEQNLLRRARGPVLDIGCGAGRHVVSLLRRGVEAVGIEISPTAAAIARSRGAVVLDGSIFDLALERRWATALLLDGNLGIGGDAGRLLRQVATAIVPGGRILIELEPPASGPYAERVRLERRGAVSEWVPWHFVPADEADSTARSAGLEVAEAWDEGGRWFAVLRQVARP